MAEPNQPSLIMKTIRIDLPKELEEIELHTFADEHMGDPLSDLERLKERIEHVKNTPNAYAILNGDLIDNAIRTSIGDVYTQEFNPMEQLRRAVELFGGIKDKILCITHGNHENRSYKDTGLNMSRMIAMQLGLEDKFTEGAALLFIRVGTYMRTSNATQICYTIYVNHGRGGGRKEGAKAIRLADMASIVDADIYMHAHTHLPMTMKQGFYRVNYGNSSVAFVTKLFVNTASNLNYGGYGEVGEFKPNTKETPVVFLSGVKKDMKALL